jgi:hypothetical protein
MGMAGPGSIAGNMTEKEILDISFIDSKMSECAHRHHI